MKLILALPTLAIYSAVLIIGCDREDPESPEGSLEIGYGEPEQGSDTIVLDPDSVGGSDAIEVDLGEEAVDLPPEDVPPPAQEPVLVAQAFSMYRINVTEMKTACPGNTVAIEKLDFKVSGDVLVDTFAGYPNDPDPKYNSGKVGVYDAMVSTSGNYSSNNSDFYPFEAFGGGFGGGWWSTRDSFQSQTPAPAMIPVWYQISFMGVELEFESIAINGGSVALGAEFESCSPHSFTITGSNDGQTWEVLADAKNLDTQNGAEVLLKYPQVVQQPQS